MNAGRELDALVAKKVMGWTRCDRPEHGPECSYWFDIYGKGHNEEQFSTDIASAWTVVEKLLCDGIKSRGLYDPLIRTWSGLDDGQFGVNISEKSPMGYSDTPDFHEIDVTAETIPLAICLAALQAVGAEIPA